MTKSEYIKQHPKSFLAEALTSANWPNNTEICLVSGLNAPWNKNSNLYKALQGTSGEYVVGGHLKRGTEGWHYAIKKTINKGA